MFNLWPLPFFFEMCPYFSLFVSKPFKTVRFFFICYFSFSFRSSLFIVFIMNVSRLSNIVNARVLSSSSRSFSATKRVIDEGAQGRWWGSGKVHKRCCEKQNGKKNTHITSATNVTIIYIPITYTYIQQKPKGHLKRGGGRLEGLKFGLYLCIPIFASYIYSYPENINQVVELFRYVEYPAEVSLSISMNDTLYFS